MGLIKSIGGLFGTFADKPKTTALAAETTDIGFLTPQIFQVLGLAAQLGMDLGQILEPYTTTKPGPESLTVIPIGGGKLLDVGKLVQELPNLYQKVQDKAISNFQDTYTKLSGIPALQGVFSEAGGDTSAFNAKFGAIFDSMAGAALGSAAPKGFLNDPTVQANVLGPTALNKAMFEKQLQQNSLQQALSLSGAGALPGLSANAGLGPGTLAPYQQSAFGGTQLALQHQGFQAGLEQWKQQMQFEQEKAADSSLWNIASLYGG